MKPVHHLERSEDGRDMALDGLFLHVQGARNFLVRLAGTQALQHLQLARRQAAAVTAGRQLVRNEGHERRHIDLTRQHEPDRRQQRARAGRLGAMAARTGLQRATHIQRVFRRRQHQYRQAGMASSHLLQHLQAGHLAHAQVHQHQRHVRMLGQTRQALQAVVCLEDHHRVPLVTRQTRQHGRHAVAEHRMIVNQQDFHRGECSSAGQGLDQALGVWPGRVECAAGPMVSPGADRYFLEFSRSAA